MNSSSSRHAMASAGHLRFLMLVTSSLVSQSVVLRTAAVTCLAIGITYAAPTRAEEADAQIAALQSTRYLDEIIVTATRREERIFNVPASVSVITQQEIQRTEVSSFRELFRYTPGVAMVRDRRSRAGEANVEIRGLGGRRVLMSVDGVRLPDGFGAAGVSDQSRGKLEVESLSRVEIVRGPNSSLYGSDALGGIVAFQTKRPDDLFGGGGNFGAAFGTGYDSVIDGAFGVADVAGRAGDVAALASFTYRNQGELENNHTIGPDPQDIGAYNVLGKLEWTPGETNLFTLTGEFFRVDTATDRQSANASVGPPPIRIFSATLSDDRSERKRFGISWRWTPDGSAWLESANAQVDYQESTTLEESTFNVMTVGGGPPRSVARFNQLNFNQDQWSSTGQVALRVPEMNWVSGILGYEWVRRDTAQRDDQTETGISPVRPQTNVVDGNVYPQKLYPDTRTDLVGLYAQVQLDLFDGALTILPSARYDHYDLSPRPDALFANANVVGFTPTGLNANRFTPRVGATWKPMESISVFGNYAQGFRTPGPEQLNRIGRVPVATFVHDFLPNPNLGPETSRGFEAGVRGNWSVFSGELSVYHTKFRDFIDTALITLIPAGTQGNPLTIRRFQSVNVDEVRIRGIEGKANLYLGELSPSLQGFQIRSAFNVTDGDNITDSLPLNSTPPAQAVIGLTYDSSGERWGAELYGKFVGKSDDVAPVSSQGTVVPHVTQGGYATFDASFYVSLFGNTRVNFQATNIFNQHYAEWADLVHLPAGDPQVNYFSAPGRAFAVSLRTRF